MDLTKHAGMTLDPTDPVTFFSAIFSQHNGHAYNHTIDKYSDNEYPPLESTVGALINAIKGLFINPWNTYFQAKLHLHQDAQIREYAESFQKEHSTTAIAMAIKSTTTTSKPCLTFLMKTCQRMQDISSDTTNSFTSTKNFHLGACPSTQAKNHMGTPTKPTTNIGKTRHNHNLRNNHLTKNDKNNVYKNNTNKSTNAHKTKPRKGSPPND